jgi:hypothetical protein
MLQQLVGRNVGLDFSPTTNEQNGGSLDGLTSPNSLISQSEEVEIVELLSDFDANILDAIDR